MISTLINTVKMLIAKKATGILVSTLVAAAAAPVIKDLFDEENQKKAYDFVKELNLRNDLSNKEKAKLFNEKFIEWAKAGGKAIAESVINCLREMAVNALKCEKSNK